MQDPPRDPSAEDVAGFIPVDTAHHLPDDAEGAARRVPHVAWLEREAVAISPARIGEHTAYRSVLLEQHRVGRGSRQVDWRVAEVERVSNAGRTCDTE